MGLELHQSAGYRAGVSSSQLPAVYSLHLENIVKSDILSGLH